MESGSRELPGYLDYSDDAYAEEDAEDQVYRGMAIAQHYLRPPTQNLEFFAKTLMNGKTWGCEIYIDTPDVVRVILGTPLYVGLAAPFPEGNHVGLIPD